MKKVIVDFRISDEEKNNLLKLGYDFILCPPCSILYDAVCGHPDMMLHLIDSKTAIVHKDMDVSFINKLKSLNISVILSKEHLKRSYPYDIILNALNFGDLFVHNLKYTEKNILNHIKGKKLINVKQGYTKCSTAVVSKNAIITSDPSILKALSSENVDILFIPPGDILLPGLDYGFIGGSCGLLEKGVLAFYGNLDNFMYGKKVLEFLKKHNVKPVYLSRGKLIDRGTIIRL